MFRYIMYLGILLASAGGYLLIRKIIDRRVEKNTDTETIIVDDVYYNDKTILPEGFDLKNKKMNFVDNYIQER